MNKPRMRKSLFGLFWIILSFFNYGYLHSIQEKKDEVSLGERVLSIGDTRDEYEFFSIDDAKMSSKNEIFISDKVGCFVAKYDFKGNFLAKIGRKGAGGSDFGRPLAIEIFQDELYVLDSVNGRIAIINTDFRNRQFSHVKLQSNQIGNNLFTINKNLFLHDIFSMKDNVNGKIRTFDRKGKTLSTFFTLDQYEKTESKKDELQRALSFISSKLRISLSHDRREIITTYRYSANPIRLYILDLNGSIKKSLTIKVNDKYTFPAFLSNYPIKYPKTPVHFCKVEGLFSYQSYIIVFVDFVEADSTLGERINQKMFVLDKKGNVLSEKSLSGTMYFFDLSSDGYLIGTDISRENPAIDIYKLNIISK